jgi:hypothetical protein
LARIRVREAEAGEVVENEEEEPEARGRERVASEGRVVGKAARSEVMENGRDMAEWGGTREVRSLSKMRKSRERGEKEERAERSIWLGGECGEQFRFYGDLIPLMPTWRWLFAFAVPRTVAARNEMTRNVSYPSPPSHNSSPSSHSS